MFGRVGALNPMFGVHHSDETKKLMSIKQSGENNGMFGRQRTDEEKHNMRYKNIETRNKEKDLVKKLEKWLETNVLPDDITWAGKVKGFPEKRFQAKELIKRGILLI